MGFFSFFNKGVSGYTDEYDYRIDVVLKCTQELFGGGDIGINKTKSGFDFQGSKVTGFNFQGIKGIDLTAESVFIISNRYKDEIEDNFRKGISFNKSVRKISILELILPICLLLPPITRIFLQPAFSDKLPIYFSSML